MVGGEMSHGGGSEKICGSEILEVVLRGRFEKKV